MADTITNIRAVVKVDNLDKAANAAKGFRTDLEQGAKAVNTIKMPASALSQATVIPGAAAINSARPKGSASNPVVGESKSYRSVGAGAGTGSASSDFAAQASGLGGLVHVYATFAANIFAVGAAFTALSKAMDTTNLIAGLDQLGAATGRNLGSMAKQMVKVTQGAMSMSQAATSTAMAAAGGMSNTQMLRMAKVAQQASLALGRDLPDSMERLTKGIIKSQPELLDELGIMTRMIPAQQAYAEKIGKTVTSLTTFEKQQAFTNAVLEEGERKFKAIELNSNPYSKVLASIQNLTQSGLELVNKVLGPLVEILSSNPTALAGVLGLIAATLLKQAIPALGMMKENAKAAAEQSKLLAVTKASEAKKGYKAEALAAKQAAVDIANTELEKAKQLSTTAKAAAAERVKLAEQEKIRKIADADRALQIAKNNAERVAEIKNNELDTLQAKMEALAKKEEALSKNKKASTLKILKDPNVQNVKPEQIDKMLATAKGLETKAINANLAAKQAALAGDKASAASNEALYQTYKKSSTMQREYAAAVIAAREAHASYMKSQDAASAVHAAESYKASKVILQAREEEARAIADSDKVVKSSEAARLQALAKVAEAEEQFNKTAKQNEKWYIAGNQTRVIAERALLKATTDNILAQTAQTASTKGFFAAWKEGQAEIAKAKLGSSEMIKIPVLDSFGKQVMENGVAVTNLEKIITPPMGNIRALWTSLKVGIGAATTAIGTFLNFAGPWIQIIGLAVVAFEMLDSWLTSSAKELSAFSESSDTVKSSLANVYKTLEAINKKDLKDFLSIESLQAKANALTDLSASVTKLVSDYSNLIATQNVWDKAIDGFMSGMFGKGSVDKLRVNLSNSIVSALKAAESGPAKDQAIKTLKNLLGEKVDVSNLKAIDEALFNLDEASVSNALRTIPDVLQNLSRESANAAAPLTAFAQSLLDISKQSTVMTNALIPRDDFSKMGMEIAKTSKFMEESLKAGPIEALLTLEKLSGNIQALSFLPKGTAEQLGSASKELKRLAESISALQKTKQEASANMDTNTTIISDNKGFGMGYSDRLEKTRGAETGLKAAQDVYNITVQRLKKEEDAAAAIRKEYENLPEQFAQSSFKLLAKGLAVAMNDSAVNSAKGFLSIMQQGGSNVESELIGLEKQQISGQIALIKSNFSIVEQQARLAATIEKNSLVQEQANLLEQAKSPISSETNRDALYKKIEAIQKALDSNTSKFSIINDGGKSASVDASKGVASPATLAAMKDMEGYMTALFGMWGQIAGKQSELYVLNLKQMVAEKNELVIADERILSARSRDLTNQKTLLDMQKGNATYVSSELASKLAKNAADSIDTKLALDSLNIRKQQNANSVALEDSSKRLLNSSGKTNAKELEHNKLIKSTISYLDEQTKSMKETAELDKSKLDITVIQANELAKITYEKGIQASIDADRFNTDKESLSTKQSQLKFLMDIGAITAQEYTQRQAILELEQQSLVYANDKQLAADKYNSDMLAKGIALANTVQANPNADTSVQVQQINDTAAAYERQLALLDLIYANKTNIIERDKTQKLLVDAQNEAMTKMVSLTEVLANAFGDVGAAIGTMGQEVLKFNAIDEQLAVRRTALTEQYKQETIEAEKAVAAARLEFANAGGDNGNTEALTAVEEKANRAKAAADKKYSKDKETLDKKVLANELNAINKTAGAAKKMFAEKTAAYKILDGIEKASAAYKAAMDLKELAMDMKKFAVRIGLMESETVANTAQQTFIMSERAAAAATDIAITSSTEATKNATKTPGVFMTFLEWLGPPGMAAAAVAIAAVLGSSGGSSTVSTVGMTAEDMQQSQGTGQSWQDGKLVDNGGGVFGDSEAKSQSIANSLSILEANSIEGLSFANKQTDLLAKINDGIKGVAEAAYGVQGIRTGSGFGTTEKSTNNPGFLGLFASSSSTSIINAGIKLVGTFESLGVAGDGLIQQFETVQNTKTSSGIFGIGASSKTWVDNNLKPLEEKAANAIRETFSFMGELLVDSGESIGLTVGETLARINSLNIDISASLKGLTGSESTEELNAVFSSILDDAYAKLAPSLKKFRNFGEGMAETFTRVTSDFDKVNLAFESMGLSTIGFTEIASKATSEMLSAQATAEQAMIAAKNAVPKFALNVENIMSSENNGVYKPMDNSAEIDAANTLVAETAEKYRLATEVVNEANASMTTKGYDVSEAISKAAGGLDKFQQSAQLFAEIFLTEGQRFDIARSKSTDRMAEIGSSNDYVKDLFRTISEGNDSLINTKDEYYAVVQAAQASANVAVNANDKVGKAQQEAAVAAYTALMDPALLNGFNNIWENQKESAQSAYDLQTRLMRAQGDEAGALARELSTSRQQEVQDAIDAGLILDATSHKLVFLAEDVASFIDTIGMSASNLSGILSSAIKDATSAEDARKKASDATKDAISNALIDAMSAQIVGVVMTGIITPMMTNLVGSSVLAGTNLATGSMIAGTNLAVGSTVAGTNLVTGATVGATNIMTGATGSAAAMALGGTVAGQNVYDSSVDAANATEDAAENAYTNLTNGGAGAAKDIAKGATASANTIITTANNTNEAVASTANSASSAISEASNTLSNIAGAAIAAANGTEFTPTEAPDPIVITTTKIEAIIDNWERVLGDPKFIEFIGSTIPDLFGDMGAAGYETFSGTDMLPTNTDDTKKDAADEKKYGEEYDKLLEALKKDTEKFEEQFKELGKGKFQATMDALTKATEDKLTEATALAVLAGKNTDEATAAVGRWSKAQKDYLVGQQKQTILDEINSLTLTRAQLLEKERADIDEANLTEFDRLQLIKENNRIKDLELELLNVQGRTHEALLITREKELATLTEAEKLTKQKIYDAQDLAKTQDLQISLMELEGKGQEATLLNRKKILVGLSATDAATQNQIWINEDLNKVKGLEVELMQEQGLTYQALLISREQELFNLSEAEKLVKRKIYAEQDLNKTAELQSQLLVLEGKAKEATLFTRQKELRALSATDAAIQNRIWMLQDEKDNLDKTNNQQVEILNLLGKSAEALAITRIAELDAMDESLRPRQLYLYALQDEAAIRDKLKSNLKSNVDSLKGFIKSLKEAKDSLLLGDKSILTPAQKYAEAKLQKDIVVAAATAIAITEEDIAKRDEAIGKLPGVTDAFLDASRTLYASSEQYTQDFNSVLAILDSTRSSLEAQLTDAEQQLNALSTIEENTFNSNELLAQLLVAQTSTASALLAYITSGTGVIDSTGTSAPVMPHSVDTLGTMPPVITDTGTTGAVITDTMASSIEDIYQSVFHRASDPGGKAYWVNRANSDMSLAEIEEAIRAHPEARVQVLYDKLAGESVPGDRAGLDYWIAEVNSGKSKADIIKAFAYYAVQVDPINSTKLAKDIASGALSVVPEIPGFAKGGLASGVAVVGERGPELVDFATPSRVYSNKASNDLLNTRELVEEIRNLRKEVIQLRKEQQEQTGHLIASNYDATNKASDNVAKATEDAAKLAAWNQRSMLKLA